MLGIVFWVFAILILLNIAGMFMNEYYPKWLPWLELIFFGLFVAALVMITTWMFNDVKGTRTSLRVAGYLIIGSIVASIIVMLIYLCACVKTPYVMVGSGEKSDPDNYDKTAKSMIIL